MLNQHPIEAVLWQQIGRAASISFEEVKGAMFANKDGEKLRSNLEYLSSQSAAILAGYFAKIAIFSLFKVSHIVDKSSSYASTSSKSSFLLCSLEKKPQNWTLILC